jgi:hypothetical protein
MMLSSGGGDCCPVKGARRLRRMEAIDFPYAADR